MLDGMRKTQNFKRNQQQTWAAVLGEGRDGLTPVNYHCVPENSRKSNEKGNCEKESWLSGSELLLLFQAAPTWGAHNNRS